MFITKKSLPRRSFLRGAGTALRTLAAAIGQADIAP